MTATTTGNGESTVANGSAVFRVNVLDALMAARGITGEEAKAKAFRLNRTNWWKIRTGRREPKVSTALRIARVAGTTVEALWGEQG